METFAENATTKTQPVYRVTEISNASTRQQMKKRRRLARMKRALLLKAQTGAADNRKDKDLEQVKNIPAYDQYGKLPVVRKRRIKNTA